MREIKFRGRRAGVPRCWVYGYFVIEKGSCFIINDNGKFPIIAGTQCQYIGEKDKNRKEIYEEDIFRLDELYGFIYPRVISYFGLNILKLDLEMLEIISNTIENPELPKKELKRLKK